MSWGGISIAGPPLTSIMASMSILRISASGSRCLSGGRYCRSTGSPRGVCGSYWVPALGSWARPCLRKPHLCSPSPNWKVSEGVPICAFACPPAAFPPAQPTLRFPTQATHAPSPPQRSPQAQPGAAARRGECPPGAQATTRGVLRGKQKWEPVWRGGPQSGLFDPAPLNRNTPTPISTHYARSSSFGESPPPRPCAPRSLRIG